MKRKNPGISLLISLGVSFLVLGIALSVIASINRAVQRSADLGRANQVFFAAESGLEAAFFHHNARGQGILFEDSQHHTQNISLSATSSSVAWQVIGREAPVVGLLREGQKIQIPLFWDSSENPGKDPPLDDDDNFDPAHSQAGGLLSPNFFELTFTDEDIPSGFDFGSTTNAILIDWSVSRENIFDGLQTFIPNRSSDGIACGSGSTSLCFQEFLTAGGAIVDPSLLTQGEIIPGKTPSTLNAFMSDGNSQKFTLSFQPLLPFEDSSGAKIEGIPFSLEADNGISLPREAYQVKSAVSIGNFSKTISARVPEKTTIGAFDYIIFD